MYTTPRNPAAMFPSASMASMVIGSTDPEVVAAGARKSHDHKREARRVHGVYGPKVVERLRHGRCTLRASPAGGEVDPDRTTWAVLVAAR